MIKVGIIGATSAIKYIGDSVCRPSEYDICKYAFEAATAYMRSYSDDLSIRYSGVAPVGMLYYRCDGQVMYNVFELPIGVRLSYKHSKVEVFSKLSDWLIDECNRIVDVNKGHSITFDVEPFMARKA